MAETLTRSQRLRAFITGKVERITELEKVLETRDTRITMLEAESKKWSAEAQRQEKNNKDTNDSLVKMSDRVIELEGMESHAA